MPVRRLHERWMRSLWIHVLRGSLDVPWIEEHALVEPALAVDLLFDARDVPDAPVLREILGPLAPLLQGHTVLVELLSRPVDAHDLDRACALGFLVLHRRALRLADTALRSRLRQRPPLPRELLVVTIGCGHRRRLWAHPMLQPWPSPSAQVGRRLVMPRGWSVLLLDSEAAPVHPGWELVGLTVRVERLETRVAQWMQEGAMGEVVKRSVAKAAEDLQAQSSPPMRFGELLDRLEKALRAEREAERRGLERGLKRGIEQGIQKGIEQGIKQGIKQGIRKGRQQGKRQALLAVARQVLGPEEARRLGSQEDPKALQRELVRRLRGALREK